MSTRAIDEYGQTIDVCVSARRDTRTARRFFTMALGVHGEPAEVVSDRSWALRAVIGELIPGAFHDTARHANNRIEADHGRLKERSARLLRLRRRHLRSSSRRSRIWRAGPDNLNGPAVRCPARQGSGSTQQSPTCRGRFVAVRRGPSALHPAPVLAHDQGHRQEGLGRCRAGSVWLGSIRGDHRSPVQPLRAVAPEETADVAACP